MPPPRQLICFVILWVLVLGSRGPELRAERPEVGPPFLELLQQQWEVDEWLPNLNVRQVVQTADGFFWLATADGLGRFDGANLTMFSSENTPGLESNDIRSIFVSREGHLWLGLDHGGITRKVGGEFKQVTPVNRSADARFTASFAQDASGAIWFGRNLASIPTNEGTEQVVYRWENGRLERYGPEHGIPSGRRTPVRMDRDGRIWVYGRSQCGFFADGVFQVVDPDGGGEMTLTPSKEGGMWATRASSLLRYAGDGSVSKAADLGWLSPASTKAGEAGAAADRVTALCESLDGTLWLGVRDAGLFYFRGGSFGRVFSDYSNIRAIKEDQQGNIWIATGNGLKRLKKSHLTLWKRDNGLDRNQVVSLVKQGEGGVWMALQAGAVLRAGDKESHRFEWVPDLPKSGVRAMCAHPRGGVWIGYVRSQLVYWEAGRVKLILLPKPQEIRALFCEGDGTLWIATAQGTLFRYRNETFSEVEIAKGNLTPVVFAEDQGGRLWVGTEEGTVFSRSASGAFVPVPLQGAKTPGRILFIVADEDGSVWVAKKKGGLFHWREGNVLMVPNRSALDLEDLRSMAIDQNQNFWITGGNRICEVRRGDMDALLAGKESVLRIKSDSGWNQSMHLDFVLPGNAINMVARSGDGHIWVATCDGPLEVSPESSQTRNLGEALVIGEVRVDGGIVAIEGNQVRLSPNPGPVEVHYTVPEGTRANDLRFRYRLTGLNDQWFFAGSSRVATFLKFPAGAYHFEVEVAMGEGVWQRAKTGIHFIVQKAWYELTLVRVGLVVALIIAISVMVRWVVLMRVQVRIRRLEQESALERERIRIARDMHDELGASLTRIALMGDLARMEGGEGAGERFAEISKAARAVSTTLDGIVWTVNPQNDTLKRLVGYLGEYASEYLETVGLSLSLELPDEVPEQVVASNVRNELLLVLKEALNNIGKHAGATTVELSLEVEVDREGTRLRMIVADNGKGFAPDSVAATSNGLRNMKERMSALRGEVRIEARSGGGTRIAFSVGLA